MSSDQAIENAIVAASKRTMIRNPSFGYHTGEGGSFPTPGRPVYYEAAQFIHPWLTDLREAVLLLDCTKPYELPHIIAASPTAEELARLKSALEAGTLQDLRKYAMEVRTRQRPCYECTRAYVMRSGVEAQRVEAILDGTEETRT